MKPGESKFMPKNVCAGCGANLDTATVLEDGGIKPGDYSICLYCGHIAILGDDGHLRALTDQEMYDVAGDPRIIRVQKARMKTQGAK